MLGVKIKKVISNDINILSNAYFLQNVHFKKSIYCQISRQRKTLIFVDAV